MEDGAISDGQITASSEFSANHAAKQGRLHLQETFDPWKSGSWSVLTNDVNQWLQVDLRDRYIKATRVATQGRSSYIHPQWVTTYKLQYSNDEETFKYYREKGQTTDKVSL